MLTNFEQNMEQDRLLVSATSRTPWRSWPARTASSVGVPRAALRRCNPNVLVPRS